MIIKNSGPRISRDEVILFPFDDYSISFQHGVRLQLVGHKTPIGRSKIVLETGNPGAPDSKLVVPFKE